MGSIAVPEFDLFSGYYNVINGKLTSTVTTRHSLDPATEKPNPEVPVSTADDVDAAVEAAKAAFKPWSRKSYAERKEAMLAYTDAIEKYIGDFSKLLTQEQGKPLKPAYEEMMIAIGVSRAMCSMKFEDETVTDNEEKRLIIRYTPLGVAVGIVPWNFPVYLAMIKIVPALLTGNTIIMKASPFTPYCGLKMVELGQKFFPPGVLQALSGDDSLGPMLTSHPGPDKISFTGSSVTGKKVMESAAKTLKRVTLELGGKDPAIICADVDIPSTAAKIASLAFMNSGQICIAIKRIYVHESIYEPFREAIIKFVQTLKVGNGKDEGVFMGPVNNSMQYERVKTFFNDIEKDNLNVAVGATKIDGPGYFLTPTIIDRPADDSRIAVEEPFGPIVPLMTWSDEDEVIDRANSGDMGLGASVWSRNLEQVERIARQIDAGYVWMNTHLELDPFGPMGGHKSSGMGAELGMSGLKSYCNVQTLVLKK